MIAGLPQWMALRAVTYGGGAGSTNESMYACLNGQDKLAGTAFSESVASHNITGGPTTAGPIIIEVNGTFWALQFNQPMQAPDYVWNALIKTTDANAGGQWAWS